MKNFHSNRIDRFFISKSLFLRAYILARYHISKLNINKSEGRFPVK